MCDILKKLLQLALQLNTLSWWGLIILEHIRDQKTKPACEDDSVFDQ